MSAKYKNITLVCVMAVLIFGFSLWCILKPQDAFSDSERRALAQMPQFSLASVLQENADESFMRLFEEYSLDQFPLRDTFRRLKSIAAYYIFHRKDNNGIYLEDGYAAKLEYPISEGSLDYAVKKFRTIRERFLKGTEAKVYACVIPDKGYFLAEPNGYLSMDYDQFYALFRDKMSFADFIDIRDTLSIDDYYRTDTHWRQDKLPETAKTLAAGMGTALTGEYEERLLEHPFYGVYYGQSALPLPAEEIRYLVGDFMEACTVYDHQNGKEISFYDMEKAAGKDPYEMFLSGNLSVVTIENPNASTEKEMIVFRDSFGSSLIPLLAQGYRKITVVDIRYIQSANLQILRDQRTGKPLIDFKNADDVLFLYSTLVLNNSGTLR
ncbi:MAG: hypothetical protein IJD59_06280 [Clostridia bacterium]|nr:hypothetical protein [Clostridia bacterium]